MHWLGIAFATKSAACSVEKLLAVQRVDSHSVAKLLPDVSALPHLQDVPICLFLSKLDLLDGRLQTHANALRGLLDREQSSEALGADAAVALIKQRYADVCLRCSQVHMVNLLDKKQTRKALDQLPDPVVGLTCILYYYNYNYNLHDAADEFDASAIATTTS